MKIIIIVLTKEITGLCILINETVISICSTNPILHRFIYTKL